MNATAAALHILFLGNSFTSVNDLPKTFAAVAASLGTAVETEAITPGGRTLEAHAADPAVRARIAARTWDFVVLQEQSQRPAFSAAQVETQVVPAALSLDALIRAAGARTVFYETWGRRDGDQDNCRSVPDICTYEGMQRRLDETYRDLAKRTAGLLSPAGEAWLRVRMTHPEIPLYAADGIHPSPQGTYLAACTLYAAVRRTGVVGADALGLPPDQAAILQHAAQDAVFTRPKVK
jgi:hypothetical protein